MKEIKFFYYSIENVPSLRFHYHLKILIKYQISHTITCIYYEMRKENSQDVEFPFKIKSL